jgi:hypothetical protein
MRLAEKRWKRLTKLGATRADKGSFDFESPSLREADAPLRMTDQKTGSRSSPSEVNRGDVHLDRIWRRGKSCPGFEKIRS